MGNDRGQERPAARFLRCREARLPWYRPAEIRRQCKSRSREAVGAGGQPIRGRPKERTRSAGPQCMRPRRSTAAAWGFEAQKKTTTRQIAPKEPAERAAPRRLVLERGKRVWNGKGPKVHRTRLTPAVSRAKGRWNCAPSACRTERDQRPTPRFPTYPVGGRSRVRFPEPAPESSHRSSATADGLTSLLQKCRFSN